MSRYLTIALTLLAALWWGVAPTTAHAGGVQPPNDGRRQIADEAFATYVGWAAEDLRAGDGFKLTLGPARVPVGYRNLTGPTAFLEAPDPIEPDDLSTFGPSNAEGMAGIGVTLSLPRGLSYSLHYGSGNRAGNRNLFASLERDLALRINRAGMAQAYGGSIRWQTPLEGFALKGGISQMRLSADAATLSTPLWSAAGVAGSSRGRLFNTTRTWRAGAEQTIGNLRLSAEYVQNRTDARFNNGVQIHQIGEGYTGMAAYQINSWFRVGSSYSLYFSDRQDRNGEALAALGEDPAGAWIQDIGISARFDLNTRMALHLEGHLMNGLLGVVEGTDEDWRRFGARMTINF